jgi:predicted FMN-binding regulatory protein PaiB
MYVADQYRMPDADLRRRVAGVRVGNLITYDPVARRPVATFLPWVFAPDPDRLLTHVGRVNEQWRHDQDLALVVIDGLHAAVEAPWRASHAEGHSSPGLDYETVHVWGELSAADDLDAILDSWDRLMVGHDNGLRVADMDPGYLEAKAKATVAVTLRIVAAEGKSKLSQSESLADLETITERMAEQCPALADRLVAVALPYVRRREAAVAEARRNRIVAMAKRIAEEAPDHPPTP